jgi:actin-related protein 8
LTEKYGLRAYDEIILAPMVGSIFLSLTFPFLAAYHLVLQCLFEPRVIEFDNKQENLHPIGHNVTEEIIGQQGDVVVSVLAHLSCLNNSLNGQTNAMVISTQHLMPTTESESLTTPQNPLSAVEATPGL